MVNLSKVTYLRTPNSDINLRCRCPRATQNVGISNFLPETWAGRKHANRGTRRDLGGAGNRRPGLRAQHDCWVYDRGIEHVAEGKASVLEAIGYETARKEGKASELAYNEHLKAMMSSRPSACLGQTGGLLSACASRHCSRSPTKTGGTDHSSCSSARGLP